MRFGFSRAGKPTGEKSVSTPLSEMATATVEAAAAGGVAHTMRCSPSSSALVWLAPKRQSRSDGSVEKRVKPDPLMVTWLGSGLGLEFASGLGLGLALG